MGSGEAMAGDAGGLVTAIEGAGDRNRRGGRTPFRGMRTDLTVEPRANRFVFNAVLIDG
jgi:hypothetical protein